MLFCGLFLIDLSLFDRLCIVPDEDSAELIATCAVHEHHRVCALCDDLVFAQPRLGDVHVAAARAQRLAELDERRKQRTRSTDARTRTKQRKQ